jgi:RimJ/RimL family protein N-acetyltransferase
VIEISRVDVDGLPRLVAVHNAVYPGDPASVEELVDWRRQAEEMVWILASSRGEDLGAGIGLVGWHSRPGTASVRVWTLPERRGRGVGHALHRKLLGWATERGCVAVETIVAEDDAASLAWAGRRGFREIGRDSRLALDLEAIEPPVVGMPDGIAISTWAERPGIERGLYRVFVEASPDIPGADEEELPSFETWLSNDMQGTSDRPEAVFVAFADDEVVGYAKLALSQSQMETAWHDLTGVKRAWRGRGIAGALKCTQIAWAKAQGYRRLVTHNEERNEPIRRLNERYGYRPEPGRVVLRTELPSDAGARG